ncbi:three-Cys-motif partner protein TcmP [Novosphingobium panipatense]|uniref:three-Cys-motif partner protein TcmP n=1 Tax=Novosphingobium panipatense TaxID=428991 RepID=UPI0039A39611
MSLTERAEHTFGGGWTEIKLNAVSDYLNFYTRALQARPSPANPFETWYIDAFAGTGDRTVERHAGSLFTPGPGVMERVRLEGSARRAIAIDPPFRHLAFIEKDPNRFAALESLKTEFPNRDIHCVQGDANDELRNIFTSGPWVQSGRSGLQRAVVFLDPYGMSVRWDTLRQLANTQRADVWYLFPLHAALRQLSHNHTALDAGKRGALNEVFGTADWEEHFYNFNVPQTNLFDFTAAATPARSADPDKVERFAAGRLKTIFKFVSEPIPILTRHKLRQFSLFLLSGNPQPKAISLITKGVTAQIKKYGRQSLPLHRVR